MYKKLPTIILYSIAIFAAKDLFASAQLPEDEFNPVDVIDEYYSSGKTDTESKYALVHKLLSDLIETQTPATPVEAEMQKEIKEILIPANLASSGSKTSPVQTSRLTSSELNRKLWETTIAISNDFEDDKKIDLQRVIEKVKSLNFEQIDANRPAKPVVEDEQAVAEPEEVKVVQPVEKAKPVEIDGTQNAEKISATNPAKISAEVLEKIETQLSGQKDPYGLAEVLFHGGYYRHAALCYRQTLKSGVFEDSPESKAWVLFQLANCLKTDEPAEAIKVYSRVVTEYPDSTWAKAARQYSELINLQLRDKPYELIGQQIDDLQETDSDER